MSRPWGQPAPVVPAEKGVATVTRDQPAVCGECRYPGDGEREAE
jgi:hypothetical protein